MKKKGGGTTLDPETARALSWPGWAKERWRIPAPYDTVFTNGHPFTVDPPEGIFGEGEVYEVENYQKLEDENRGSPHRDGRIFYYHRVGHEGQKPSLIIRR